MTCVDVTTQQGLDAAIDRGDHPHLTGDGEFTVTGSATVRASGSATVEAYGSATVEASDSATVRAYDSATVEAYGSATVEASDSATVRASGSATVEASGSATVEASGSATVEAYGSATVRASGSATVEATKYVAVQDHGPSVSVTGGVLIQVRRPTNGGEWCEFYGVEVTDGVATLYKAVEDDWRGGHKTSVTYRPGDTPEAPDWDGGKEECGGGLHFSPRPYMARTYCSGATKYVGCPVRVEDIVVHPDGSMPDKVKAKGVCAPVFEVDEDGTPVPATTAVTG